MNRLDGYAWAQRSMETFSGKIIQKPLYRYQLEWAQPVYDLVRECRPEVFVIEMPRQSGKNETSAQIEVACIARAGAKGGGIVKTAPTFKPQVITSRVRFWDRATAARKRLPFFKLTPLAGYMYTYRDAAITFLSAAIDSNVVSATASLLLEVDEAQDVDPAKYDKDFAPMRASTGAPVVAYGTTWTDDTLLARFKQDVEMNRVKGKVFRISPDRVADENPSYGDYVQSEVNRLGREHPLVKTQYFLEPLENRGRLFSPQQLRQVVGTHERKESRTNELQIVAGLDFAGSDETQVELTSAADLRPGGRDSVALAVGAVEWITIDGVVRAPKVRTLARYEWVNLHPAELLPTIYDLLQNKWKVNRVHCDATGVGSTGTATLARNMDGGSDTRVHAVKFTGSWEAQTRLATQYIAAVNGSRIQDYRPSGFDPIDIAWRDKPDAADPDKHIWWQRGHARLEARESRTYRVYVPEGEGHDDLLVADMLMVDAANALVPASETLSVTRRPLNVAGRH